MLETLCERIHATVAGRKGRIPYGYMKEYVAAQKGIFLAYVSSIELLLSEIQEVVPRMHASHIDEHENDAIASL